MDEQRVAAIRERAYGWRFGVGNSGQVRRVADDIYDLLDALAAREEEVALVISAWEAYAHQEDEGNRKEYWRRWHAVDDAVAALAAPPPGDGAAPVELRPEVQAFAEAMEVRLRKHDDDRGDSWKEMDSGDLEMYLRDRCFKLIRAVNSGTYEDIAKQAASVGVAAMFFADVLVAPPPAARVRAPSGQHGQVAGQEGEEA